MQLVLVIFVVSFFCIIYVFGDTTKRTEDVVIEEVNVMKSNYHELLKRVINNEKIVSDQNRREQYLKNELENIKRYMTCQMENITDFNEEKYVNLNETTAALMKTMVSFSQSLKLLDKTTQELIHRQQEKLQCEKNQTECNCTGIFIDGFYDTITSPGYPSEYSNYQVKNWSIDVGFGYRVKLMFTNFTTELSYDFVKVYDAADATDIIGSFSGDILPPPMISSGRYMFVTFTSDISGVETGFSANVHKITS